MERGIFCSKAEENGVLHCKRTSAASGFKTEVRKAYNSLSSRLARGKRESVHTRTHTVLPERALSHVSKKAFYLFITGNQDNTQRAFGCALTLYQTIFF